MYLKHKELVFLVSSAFILVLAWIFFNLYHKSTTSTLTDIQNEQIIPINPQFDTRTIESLKKRKQAESLTEIQKTDLSKTPQEPSPSVFPTTSPTASNSPSLTPSITISITPTPTL